MAKKYETLEELIERYPALSSCEDSINKAFQQQFMQEMAKQEQKRLDKIEKEMDQQQLKINTQLEAAKSELKSVEDAERSEIQNVTPKYVA